MAGAARCQQRDAAGNGPGRRILAQRHHLHPGLEIALAAFEAAALDIAARTADARGIGGPQFSLRLDRREFPDREDGEQHGADDRPRQASDRKSTRLTYSHYCASRMPSYVSNKQCTLP